VRMKKMFERMSGSSGNVVGYKLIGTLTVADYKKLEPEVKALVETQGNIRILFDMSEFEWQGVEAWILDLKMGFELHNKIEKMAIVGDKSWEKWMTHLAKPFYAQDAKYFNSGEIDNAWAWVKE
jgi:hypothetical protein